MRSSPPGLIELEVDDRIRRRKVDALQIGRAERDRLVDTAQANVGCVDLDRAERRVVGRLDRGDVAVVHEDRRLRMRRRVEVDRHDVAVERQQLTDRLAHLLVESRRRLEPIRQTTARTRHLCRRDAGEHEDGVRPIELFDVESLGVAVGTERVGKQTSRRRLVRPSAGPRARRTSSVCRH